MGVGVGTALFILSGLTLGFGIGTAVFFTKYRDTQNRLLQEQANNNEFVSASERNRDDVRQLLSAAKAEKPAKSLVGFLTDSLGGTMQKVTGRRNDLPATLEARLAAIPSASKGTPLLTVITEKDQEIASLNDRAAQAEAARGRAMQDMQNETDRVKRIEDEYKKTMDAMRADIQTYKAALDENRAGIDDYKRQLDAQLDTAKSDMASQGRKYAQQIQSLEDENVILRGQLATLRGERNKEILKASDEYALVDGQIIAVDASNNRAEISLGSRNKVVLGMTFAVYADAAAIRPDAQGNYPRGKATLEVINVGPSSSTCRITSQARGNPVITGDVIANAVYDPNKVYKFVTYGAFDANRDGISSPMERSAIEGMIREWGGKVVEDLGADVDFVVLGERPVAPPEPPSSAPPEVFSEFVRREKEVRRYDQLFQDAQKAGIPILNENRFYTLIGVTPAARR